MKVLFGLADRATGEAYVRGGLITDLQTALRMPPEEIDGIYGPATAKAVKTWQETQGHAQTGAITFEQWTELTGKDPPRLFYRCLQVTAAFEGHGFGLCNGNFDGALLTWGIIGFTLKHGEIQALTDEIDAKVPTLIASVFGSLEKQFRDGIALDVDGNQIVNWVNEISEAPFHENLRPEWDRAFRALGADETVHQLQCNRARVRYWEPIALRDIERFGMSSDLGHAMCFDIAVQCGGVSNSEAEDYRARVKARGAASAQVRRILLADVVAEHTKNTRYIEDVRTRKRTLATGKGRVHKADDDLSHWGFGEPAADPPSILQTEPAIARSAPELRFAEFIRTLSLEYFTPKELMALGAAHFRNGHAGFGLNTLPPEELWPNIRTAIGLLDRLRRELGKPIRTLSVYRSPLYNTAIGGAANSQHMRFAAIDFVVKNAGGPRDWALVLARYRAALGSGIGIGVYPDAGFVHVDGRSVAADFGTEPLSM